ncbi:hypothetical protein ACQJBY_049453 [Aegilops geniculata]
METITFCCKLTFCKWGEAGIVIRSIILLIMACGQGRPISDYIDEFCNLKVMYSILFSTFLQTIPRPLCRKQLQPSNTVYLPHCRVHPLNVLILLTKKKHML